jgi:hypothetical protein
MIGLIHLNLTDSVGCQHIQNSTWLKQDNDNKKIDFSETYLSSQKKVA